MHDVDEPEDMPLLANRILPLHNAPNLYCHVLKHVNPDRDALTRPSSPPIGAFCMPIVG